MLFLGTKKCAIPTSPTPLQGCQLGPRKGKSFPRSALLQRASRERTQGPRGPLLLLSHRLSPGSGPARPHRPSICRRWRVRRKAGARQVGRGPATASSAETHKCPLHRTHNQRPRASLFSWNDKCVARKLPTPCGCAIVCRAAGTAQQGGPGVAEAAGERGGRRGGKHAADFPHYHPNTISHEAITTQKSTKMCLLRSPSLR